MKHELVLVNGKKEYTVSFDDNQLMALDRRLKRSFHPHANQETLINNINNAINSEEIEKILISNGVCDCCQLTNINLEITKSLLEPIIKVLYKYPRVNSRLTFIGSCKGYHMMLEKLINGNDDIIKKFKLQHVLSKDDIKNAASLLIDDVYHMITKPNNFMALYMQAFNLFNGILFDADDMINYEKYLIDLKYSVKIKYLNNAYYNEKTVAYHEMGHAIDVTYNISDNLAYLHYYKSFNKNEIKEALSEYASSNEKEFFAEAFSEYMVSSVPRAMANKVMKIADYIILKSEDK